MNEQTPTPDIGFKRTPMQFLIGWKFDQTFYTVGRIIAFSIFGFSVLSILLFGYHVTLVGQLNVLDGYAVTRLMWLMLLIDLIGFYLLHEIARKMDYTSTDDVYGYLDASSRTTLAQIMSAALTQKVQINTSLLLQLLLGTGYMSSLLGRLEVNSESVRAALPQTAIEATNPLTDKKELFDEAVQANLITSAKRALDRHDKSFGVPDIFMTLLQNDTQVQQYFRSVDVTPERFALVLGWLSGRDHIRQEYQSIRTNRMHTGPRNQAWTSKPTPHLDHYSQDMSLAASYGAVPLLAVRPNQVEEVVRALSRTAKNSVLIIGEPGSGKSAIVERIALKMLSQDVPLPMQDKRLIKLDSAALHADPSGFAAIFETIVSEAEIAGNVILFIPELQDLASENTAGLASVELLLPILDRHRMQIIGATSMRQYHEQIEKSTSFANAFAVIEVPPMTIEQTVQVLQETSLELEAKHHVTISLKAMQSAAELSEQYIHDRVLPEKAIDALDEAAVLVAQTGKGVIEEADVRTVLSQITKVPLSTIDQNEQSLLLNLEAALHAKVIGQDEAVGAVSQAMRRSRAGLQDTSRPIGVFLFVGPTGVGKTELAKALASVYFHNDQALLRLDMSEFQNTDAIAKLLGTGDTDGLLTGPVRSHPFTLLLLDEFEKSSPEVRNLFLQIFDDGRATDGNGRLIDFKTSIIIATSNAGSLEIQQAVAQNIPYATIQHQLISAILPQQFRPELLNRFDGVIVFRSLTENQIQQIARLQITLLAERIKKTSGIELKVTDAAVAKIAQLGFDPQYGGRPLRRAIEDRLEGPLAQKILASKLTRGQEAIVDAADIA